MDRDQDGKCSAEVKSSAFGVPCVRALDEMGTEISAVLRGRSLRVRVEYDDGRTLAVLFTRDGHVVAVPPQRMADPHVELRGSSDAIYGFLCGTTSVLDAVFAGLLTLHIDELDVPSYRELGELLARTFTEPR